MIMPAFTFNRAYLSRFLLAAIAGTLLVIASSCRSSKSATDEADTFAKATIEERLADVVKANGEWTEINVPVKVSFKSPLDLSASGRMYMRRGSDIYLSMRVLGMEVATLYLTTDSLYAADKWHKRYIAESVENLYTKVGIDISDVQDMIVGRAFGIGDNPSVKSVDAQPCEDGWTMRPAGTSQVASACTFKFSQTDNTLQSLTVDYGSGVIDCLYSQSADTEAGRFMNSLSIDTKIKDSAVKATLRYDFGKAKWTVPESAKWKSPKGYTRLDGMKLLKALSTTKTE